VAGLRTGYKKIAQSGKTMDGREIKAQWLLEAAETYSTDIYTASIFPDHNEAGQSYGTVNALQAQTDKDGVVSLFADISPNAFWQSDMRYGQNLFTSIAVLPNFAGTGKFYMYSLAATNNPASLGVEKLEFSKKDPAALFSSVFDTTESITSDTTEDEVVSFFSRLFKSSKAQAETDMSDKALKEIQTQLDALQQKFSALSPEKPFDNQGTDNTAAFSALTVEHEDLKAKFAALEKKDADRELAFSTLQKDVEAFKIQLADALKEDPSKSTASSFSKGAAETAARLA